jgi:hypothetical protein
MSFNRLETDDFVVSADSITAGLFTDSRTATLSTFFTSSTQTAASSGDYYLNVFSDAANNQLEFAIAYGNKEGSGSEAFDSAVVGKSPSSTNYGQYRNLVLGDENADFSFGGITSSDFYAISIDRNRYKESLFPGSLTLELSGSDGKPVLSLTDNSQVATTVQFNDAGRVFQLVSGSAGSVFTGVNSNGYSENQGSYGFFLPDIATLLLNPLAISESAGIVPVAATNDNKANYELIYNAISGSGAANFVLNSSETITSDFIFIRPRSSQFNYSENPSFISGSTGEVIYSSFVNNPQTYITTVGLYNDNSELLAVAKLSKPLKKDFTKEALIRVKLDF